MVRLTLSVWHREYVLRAPIGHLNQGGDIMADYVLALDQGTTSSRAILFDHDGRLVSTAQEEFPQIYPQPGWVEHDPEAIWRTQVDTAKGALEQAEVGAAQVTAIGITNQRETTVVWDRDTGAPLHNAIVWQCRRTAAMCDQLRAAGWTEPIRNKTGLVIDAYFSGTKLAWLLEHVPGLRARAERGEALFGTIDSFLAWRLSGGQLHITDVSNASRTMLFNIHTLDWDDEILAELGIPRAMLPQVRPSSQVYGVTGAGVLGAEVPIAGAAGDQQAALFGQTCFAPGQAKNTYGTGCFLLLNTGTQAVTSERGLLTTIAWRAVCLLPGRRSSGCATDWASLPEPPRPRPWPGRWTTPAGFILCLRLSAWELLTGTLMPEGPSSA
jgi:glycerol kinase